MSHREVELSDDDGSDDDYTVDPDLEYASHCKCANSKG